MSQLSSTDETLVLASEGLLQVLPPHEVGLLLHHFNAAKLNALKQALTAAAVQQEAAAAAAAGKGARGRGSSRAKARGGRPSKELPPDEAMAAAGKVCEATLVSGRQLSERMTCTPNIGKGSFISVVF
jgi:hypothetical protein